MIEELLCYDAGEREREAVEEFDSLGGDRERERERFFQILRGGAKTKSDSERALRSRKPETPKTN